MVKVFASFDAKAAQFGTPMFIPTNGLALRMFADVVSDPKSPLNKYAADYSLYELGTYDPATGKLEALPQPAVICSASSVKEQLRVGREYIPDAHVVEAVAGEMERKGVE